MNRITDYKMGETVTVCRLQKEKMRGLLTPFGIYEGARVTVFLVSGKKAILKVGSTKLALCREAVESIAVCSMKI